MAGDSRVPSIPLPAIASGFGLNQRCRHFKLAAGRKFADMDLDAPGGGDGMTIDQRGNVYCAGQGHIWIWDPAGKLLAKIATPEGPANCTFGDPDGKTLYITARQGFYCIQLNVAGGR